MNCCGSPLSRRPQLASRRIVDPYFFGGADADGFADAAVVVVVGVADVGGFGDVEGFAAVAPDFGAMALVVFVVPGFDFGSAGGGGVSVASVALVAATVEGGAAFDSGSALAVAVVAVGAPSSSCITSWPMAAMPEPTTKAAAPPMSDIFAVFVADARSSSRDFAERISWRQLGEAIAPP